MPTVAPACAHDHVRDIFNVYFDSISSKCSHPKSHQQRRRMARYHPLPNKEHDHIDAEAATPSSNGPAVIKSKLWKYISALASFLLICIIITLVAFVPTNHHLLSTEAAFAEDLSFLSTISSTEASTIHLTADLIHVTAPPGPITRTFTLDERFRQRPSPESDEAWRSILPSTSYLSTSERTVSKKPRADDCLLA